MDSEKNLEVELDGNKVTIITDNRTRNYELGKEVTETGPKDSKMQVILNLYTFTRRIFYTKIGIY